MYMKLKDGKSKVLTLSYDDGVVQDIRFIGILDKYGLKGTFNVNTGLWLAEDVEREEYYGRMKRSEALELYKNSGHEVAVHALNHMFLERISGAELINEIVEDRRNIERDFGTLASGMAYPYGTYSDDVIETLKKCGICYSRTTKSTQNFNFPVNWLELNPTCHHSDSKLMSMAKQFVEEEPRNNQCWMFYLWGHTYEFDNRNDWNVIEEFASFTGGKDDIWYATNIEIYDYVKAYKNLQVSFDKKIIHNPSATDVWVCENNETFVVKGGETIYLD